MYFFANGIYFISSVCNTPTKQAKRVYQKTKKQMYREKQCLDYNFFSLCDSSNIFSYIYNSIIQLYTHYFSIFFGLDV